jgi:hypothetical protein
MLHLFRLFARLFLETSYRIPVMADALPAEVDSGRGRPVRRFRRLFPNAIVRLRSAQAGR